MRWFGAWLGILLLQGCLLDRSGALMVEDGGPRPTDATVQRDGATDAGTDAGPGDSGPLDAGDGGVPDAGSPDAGSPDAGPPDAGPPDAGPPDAGPPDAGPPDAGPPDAGPPDAGPCPSGPVGTVECPFTRLSELDGVPAGLARFEIGGFAFESEVDDSEGGGWMLLASADDAVDRALELEPLNTGAMRLQSHRILSETLVAALPDVGEVRINSSSGSNVVASVTSRDSYVVGQLMAYRSLHTRMGGGEDGSVRWSGDADRMTATCRNLAPGPLNRFLFQTCGASGDNLHWRPESAGNQWNRWVYDSGAPRDRLNLWVRD